MIGKKLLAFSSLFFSLSLMGVFALVLVPQIDNFFDEVTETLQASFMQTLEATTNARISYSTIGPSIFRYLEIRDFTFEVDEVEVSIERIRVYYRFSDLLRGNFLGAPEDIRVEDGVVTVKILENQDDVRPSAEEVIARVFEVIQLIPGPTEIFYRRVKLDIQDSLTRVITNFDQGNLSRNDSSLDLRTYAKIEVSQGPRSLYSSGIDLRLTSLPATNTAESYLRVFSPIMPFGTIEDVTLVATLSPSTLRVAKAFDRNPFDISVTSTLEFSEFDFQFLSENWSPRAFLSLGPQYTRPEIEGLLKGRVSGNFEARLSTLSNSATFDSYGGNLQYQGAVVGTPFSGVVDISAVGDNSGILIDSLSYQGSKNETLGFSGRLPFETLVPEGYLNFSSGNLFDLGPIRARVDLASSGPGNLRVKGSEISIFGLTIDSPSLDLEIDELGFGIVFQGLFPDPDPLEELDTLQTEAEPGLVFRVLGTNPFVDPEGLIDSLLIDGQVRSLSLSTLEELLSILDSQEADSPLPFSPSASFDGVFEITFPQGLPAVEVSNLVITNLLPQIPLVRAQGSYVDSIITLGTLGFENNFSFDLPSWIEIEGRGLIGNQGRVSFYGRSFLVDSWVDLSGVLFQNSLAFSSNIGVEGAADFRDPEIRFDLEIRDFSPPGITNLAIFADGDLRLGGSITDLQNWRIDEMSGSFPRVSEQFIFALTGTNEGITINQVLISTEDDTFVLTGNVEFQDLSPTSFAAFSTIEAVSQNSQERLNISLRIDTGIIDGNLRAENILLQRIPLSGLRGTGLAIGNFTIPLSDIFDSQGSISLELTEGLFNLDPLRGTLALGYSDRVFGIVPTTLELAETDITIEEGSFNIREEQGILSLRINDDTVLRAEAIIPLGLSTDSLEGFQASLSISEIPSVLSPEPELRLNLLGQGKEIVLTGGPEGSINGKISIEGDVELQTDSPMLIQLQAKGRIREGEFDINIPNARWVGADLSTIFDFEIFTIQRGNVYGNLRISGDLNDPSFFGTARVEGFVGNLLYSPTDLGPGNAFIILEDKNLFFPEFQITAGPSQVTAEGVLGFNRWEPETFEFDISVANPGIQIVHDFDSIIVDGNAYGDIRIRGDGSEVQVRGDLLAVESAITLSEFSEGETINEPTDDDTTVNAELIFRSARGVEFFWPSQEFPIFRSFVNPREELLLRVNTADNSFLLRGSIPVRGGEIFYIDRNFYIREGSIIFNENENFFNPRVTLDADSRAVWQDQRVTLSIEVQEDYFSELQPRFYSSPPLNAEALSFLVGGNLFPSAGDQNYNVLGEALFVTTDIVSQFGILRNFENRVRNTLGLDLFSIRTGLFQNILRDIVTPEQSLNSGLNPFGRYLQNTTIQVGKIIGEDMFLELLLDISQTDPFSSQQTNSLGLSLNPEFRIEWQTPFALVEWNWTPNNPEDLFVTDHTITFSWEFTP